MELAQKDLHAHLEQELRAPGEEYDQESKGKVQKVNILMEIYRCWHRRRTPSSIGAVTLPDGSITTDPKMMAQELSRHWQGFV